MKEDEMDGTCSMHEKIRTKYKILVEEPQRKRPLGRFHIDGDNIKIDVREISVSVQT
jgi:beta-galactosidase beta subunit